MPTPNSKVVAMKYYQHLCETYDPMKNTTPPFLTKYEKTVVKGMRLEQLYHGAPTMLALDEVNGLTSMEAICKMEMQTGKIPYLILRTLPNGEKEIWRFDDLDADTHK